MLKKSLIVAMLAALALGGAIAQEVKAPVSPSPVKRTIIGKIEVPGANYEVITAMVEIAPGFKAGRHFHPGIVISRCSTASSGWRRRAAGEDLQGRRVATRSR